MRLMMNNSRKLWTGAAFLLTAGVLFSGVSAHAQQPYYEQQYERRDIYQDRQDLRYDRRDLRRDSDRIARLRADIQHDRYRLAEDIRCGREREAARDARDLARDQRALDAQMRDVRYDRGNIYREQRDLSRDYDRRW